MADQNPPVQQNPVQALLIEFGTRLNEIEEKQRLIRDRVLLVGENLISTKEEADKNQIELKKRINEIEHEIKTLKRLAKKIVNEMDNFAKKTEIAILEKQFKMFQPLELARIKDVKKIVQEELKKQMKT